MDDKEGEKKILAELYAELNVTRNCIDALADVKAKLTKNKVTEVKLPR